MMAFCIVSPFYANEVFLTDFDDSSRFTGLSLTPAPSLPTGATSPSVVEGLVRETTDRVRGKNYTYANANIALNDNISINYSLNVGLDAQELGDIRIRVWFFFDNGTRVGSWFSLNDSSHVAMQTIGGSYAIPAGATFINKVLISIKQYSLHTVEQTVYLDGLIVNGVSPVQKDLLYQTEQAGFESFSEFINLVDVIPPSTLTGFDGLLVGAGDVLATTTRAKTKNYWNRDINLDLKGNTKINYSLALGLDSLEEGNVRVQVRFYFDNGKSVGNWISLAGDSHLVMGEYEKVYNIPAGATVLKHMRIYIQQKALNTAANILYLDDLIVEASEPLAILPSVVPEVVAIDGSPDFVIPEGPQQGAGSTFYMTDYNQKKVYELDLSTSPATYSIIHTGRVAGLAYESTGSLLICEQDDSSTVENESRLLRRDSDGSITILETEFAGTPLLFPNDLYKDATGGVYFTDKLGDAVYYHSPGQTLQRVVDNVDNVNGITLSPDESTIYITNNGTILKGQLSSPGVLAAPLESWVTMPANTEDSTAFFDGLTTDDDGNLYATGTRSKRLWVWAADKTYRGVITFPNYVYNCTFGNGILYATSRGGGLYKIVLP